jgi:hypothetical protein
MNRTIAFSVLAGVTLATLVGCASSGAVQAALQGDLKTLQAEIASAKAAGDLNRTAVEELAKAVAGREIRAAPGDAAVRRLRAVRSCAAPSDSQAPPIPALQLPVWPSRTCSATSLMRTRRSEVLARRSQVEQQMLPC